eukprot:309201-Alexandrium_andersonii.AAC.1
MDAFDKHVYWEFRKAPKQNGRNATAQLQGSISRSRTSEGINALARINHHLQCARKDIQIFKFAPIRLPKRTVTD